MLTIQLPNGKTAELSVKETLMLKTSKTIITVLPCKDEKYKSVVTTISIKSDGSVEKYDRESEETRNEEFIRILKKFETDFSPRHKWIEEEPSEEAMNRW